MDIPSDLIRNARAILSAELDQIWRDLEPGRMDIKRLALEGPREGDDAMIRTLGYLVYQELLVRQATRKLAEQEMKEIE